jgi:uridine kinase
MIINIRGTSGAGKTHLVRRLMATAGPGVTCTMGHPEKNKPLLVWY